MDTLAQVFIDLKLWDATLFERKIVRTLVLEQEKDPSSLIGQGRIKQGKHT